MKTIFLISLIVFSNSIFANESVVWKNKDTPEANISIKESLDVVQNWAKEYFKTKTTITKFEYSVIQNSEGYEFTITPVYENNLVTMDGDMCVYTSTNHKLQSAKQCYAP